MKNRPVEFYQYRTDNLIHGSAELAYCHERKHWIGLTGKPIYTIEEAIAYATKLDALITANTIRLASLK